MLSIDNRNSKYLMVALKEIHHALHIILMAASKREKPDIDQYFTTPNGKNLPQTKPLNMVA